MDTQPEGDLLSILHRRFSEAQMLSDLGAMAFHGAPVPDETNHLPVGAAWVRLLTEDRADYGYNDDDTPELAIAVMPEHQGRGIGTLLLERLLVAARSRYPAIGLTVRADNPAVSLYKRVGFDVLKEIVNRVGTPSYLMIYRY